ncbi:hypothetical protein [Actinomadura sp. SCN-SB]|uniref:hypothetical protein n=1 Tax=Actinomadura sp. SCN-SB TaxID=3373092 RepID=UPI003751BFFD
MTRGDLTDDERALIEPHLSLGARGPIPDLRKQFNGVMWNMRRLEDGESGAQFEVGIAFHMMTSASSIE